MSGITFGMVQMAMGRGADMESAEDRAEVWRTWVMLETELNDERRRRAMASGRNFAAPSLTVSDVPRSPTDASGPNLGAVLGALAGVMAASQAKPKDEDDGA